VLALASNRELHEFLPEGTDGLAAETPTGRLIIVNGDSDLLESDTIKHEISHALNHEYLITSPLWVHEGIACYLETLKIDRKVGRMVRGSSDWKRRGFIGGERPPEWKGMVMNPGSQFWYRTNKQQYGFETYSWALVHWLVDTRPQQFGTFLASLLRGELMWPAFAAAFPGLTDAQISAAMSEYTMHLRAVERTTLPLPGWSAPVDVRPMAAAEVHMIRAAVFHLVAGEERRRKTETEEALALAADPGHPIALAMSKDGDPQRAIDAHPDDWRAWMYWYEKHPDDVAAVRKAVQLAPNEPAALILLATLEQKEGKSQQAVEQAERAARIAPGQPRVLDALAPIYARNRRCDDARHAEQRAIGAISEAADRQMPLSLADRLAEIASSCQQAAKR
jgi:hypothetical protein